MIDTSARTHDVFLSYSSNDKTWADAACAVLERNRIRCWIAPRDITPGDEWGAAIIKGIHASRVMVLIFSGHANASAQVRREVERAISQGMSVVPVRIEDVRPEGAMEYALGNTHWLDAFTPPIERQLELLAQSVKTLLDKQAEPGAAPGREEAASVASAKSREGLGATGEMPAQTRAGSAPPRPLGRLIAIAASLFALVALAAILIVIKSRTGETKGANASGSGDSDTLPATKVPIADASLEADSLRLLTLQLEAAILWDAVTPAWRTRRESWAKEVAEADSLPRLAALIKELDLNVLWSAVSAAWRDRRAKWWADCDRANTVGDLATLLGEFETYLTWTAVAPGWKDFRAAWVAAVLKCKKL